MKKIKKLMVSLTTVEKAMLADELLQLVVLEVTMENLGNKSFGEAKSEK